MHLNLAAVFAAGTFLAAVDGLPRPARDSDEPIVLPVDGGFVSLGQPSSTTTWSSKKREAVAQGINVGIPQGPTLGKPETTVTWGSAEKREAEAQGISFGSPQGMGPTLSNPSSTTTWGSAEKREAEAQGVSFGSPQNQGPSLSNPGSTTTWGSGERREANPQVFGFGPLQGPTLGNPSSTTTWGESEKREADPQTLSWGSPQGPQLGSPSSTITWGENEKREADPQDPALNNPSSTINWGNNEPIDELTEGPTPRKSKRGAIAPEDVMAFKVKGSTTTWSERAAEPQISLGPVSETISWSGYGPTDSPSSCSCVSGAVGNFCGYCHQIQGSFMSWNMYHCGRGGECKNLGYKDKCASGGNNACPV